jgi:hypothetical protein
MQVWVVAAERGYFGAGAASASFVIFETAIPLHEGRRWSPLVINPDSIRGQTSFLTSPAEEEPWTGLSPDDEDGSVVANKWTFDLRKTLPENSPILHSGCATRSPFIAERASSASAGSPARSQNWRQKASLANPNMSVNTLLLTRSVAVLQPLDAQIRS